jgi:hypothetical protein
MNEEKKATLKQRRSKLVWSISEFNYAEPITIFMILMADIVHSNYITSFYLAYSLIMLQVTMTTAAYTIKQKFYASIAMSLIAFVVLICKYLLFNNNSIQQRV